MTARLDPDSPLGRRIAAELTDILMTVEIAIAKRKQREAASTQKDAA